MQVVALLQGEDLSAVPYPLMAGGHQVHLDAAPWRVVKGAMRERLQIKIGIEFPVGACQELAIECCGKPCESL